MLDTQVDGKGVNTEFRKESGLQSQNERNPRFPHPFLDRGFFYGLSAEENSQPVSNPFITLGPRNWP